MLRIFRRKTTAPADDQVLKDFLATCRPDDPGRALPAATAFIEGAVAQHGPQAGPVLLAVDAHLAPALQSFFDGLFRAKNDYHLDTLIGVAETYARTLARESLACLQEGEDLALRRLGIRHWHAWKKLARFRYYALSAADWRLGWELAGGSAPVLAPSLCFELAPLATMNIQQMELTDRVLVANAALLFIQAEPSAVATHAVSAAAYPLRVGEVVPAGGQWYLSTTKLAGLVKALDGFAGLVAPAVLVATRQALARAWSLTPPSRRAERQQCTARVQMASGFFLARRMLACAELARSGQVIEYQVRRQLSEAHAELARTLEARPAMEPLELLTLLELAGDRLMMQSLDCVNVSDTGAGVAGSFIKARPGNLVCLRDTASVDWRPALVRQIRKAEKSMFAGLEFLGRGTATASCISFDLDSPNNLASAVDAIILGDGDGDPEVLRLLLPPGTAGRGGGFLVKLRNQWVPQEVLECQEHQGQDYSLVVCRRTGGRVVDSIGSHLQDLLLVI